MKQQAERGGRETVKGTVSQSTHGSVIELRSDHLLTISAAKKNVHQSWTLATLSTDFFSVRYLRCVCIIVELLCTPVLLHVL